MGTHTACGYCKEGHKDERVRVTFPTVRQGGRESRGAGGGAAKPGPVPPDGVQVCALPASRRCLVRVQRELAFPCTPCARPRVTGLSLCTVASALSRKAD